MLSAGVCRFPRALSAVIASTSIDEQAKNQDLSLKEVCYMELFKEEGESQSTPFDDLRGVDQLAAGLLRRRSWTLLHNGVSRLSDLLFPSDYGSLKYTKEILVQDSEPTVTYSLERANSKHPQSNPATYTSATATKSRTMARRTSTG